MPDAGWSEGAVTDACAAIVERDDPHLHSTALFAAEPARSRLMVLYAFDCELSRAVQASKESLIPRMRLQWWRDAITEAGHGKPPKAHEVAVPLAELLSAPGYMALHPVLNQMIDAREMELSGLNSDEDWRLWAQLRFRSRVQAAMILLDATSGEAPDIAEPMALAFALRTARAMAMRDGQALLPQVRGEAISAIARDEDPGPVVSALQSDARTAMEALDNARNSFSASRSAVPALLPLLRDRRVLRLASAPGFTFGDLDEIDRPFDGLKLAWRAALGRW